MLYSCTRMATVGFKGLMELFRTANISIVRECQIMFQFSELPEKRTKKFIHDYDKFAAPLIDVHCG